MRTNLLLFIISISFLSCADQKEKPAEIAQEPTWMNETYRPQYHFTPEEKWMNDPNGLVYQNGEYHLFFQHYPDSTVWGPMHWGHAVSKNLVNWEHKPIALFPDSLGYIFSGSAVIDERNTAGFGEDAMVAIYTYHNPNMEKDGRQDFQYQGIAYSLDNGDTWSKYEGNPVLPNSGIRDFRDPKVFWNEATEDWKMILAAGDHLQLFSSPNLKDWTMDSEFHDPVNEPNGVWECPDLFPLTVEGSDEVKWVLLISHNPGAPNGGSGTRYFIGDYDGKKFTTDQERNIWLDYGTDNYAGVTFNNTPDNKRIFIGWMSNWNYATVTPTETWRSANTLPRELELHSSKDGSVYLSSFPVESLSKIVEEKISEQGIDLSKEYSKEFDLSQAKLELDFTAIPEDFEISFHNPAGDKLILGFNKEASSVYLDRRTSGRTGFSDKFASKVQQMPVEDLEEMKLVIYLDRSSVELFLNEGQYSMTNQVFPTSPFNTLRISSGSGAQIGELSISEVKRIW